MLKLASEELYRERGYMPMLQGRKELMCLRREQKPVGWNILSETDGTR